MTEIQCVSLWQPWASLLVSGEKTNETRSWPWARKGWMAIHAADLWAKPQRAICTQPYFKDAITRMQGGVFQPDELPRKAIIGAVLLSDCVPTDGIVVEGQERAFGDYGPNRFAWVTTKRVMLPRPVAYSGHQGVFKVPLAPFLEQIAGFAGMLKETA